MTIEQAVQPIVEQVYDLARKLGELGMDSLEEALLAALQREIEWNEWVVSPARKTEIWEA